MLAKRAPFSDVAKIMINIEDAIITYYRGNGVSLHSSFI